MCIRSMWFVCVVLPTAGRTWGAAYYVYADILRTTYYRPPPDRGVQVGGLTLNDEVGIDVSAHVVKNLMGEQPRYLGVRMEGGDLRIMDDMVAAGYLGKKSGKGYFDHTVKGSSKTRQRDCPHDCMPACTHTACVRSATEARVVVQKYKV